MKGVFLYKDGTRVPMPDEFVGCQKYIKPFSENGRLFEREFVADNDVVDGVIVYREGQTTDRTEQYADT